MKRNAHRGYPTRHRAGIDIPAAAAARLRRRGSVQRDRVRVGSAQRVGREEAEDLCVAESLPCDIVIKADHSPAFLKRIMAEAKVLS